MKARHALAAGAIAIGTLAALPLAAGANSGGVTLTNSCHGGYGTVVLHNNVAPKHRVDVLSTIAGRPGFTDHHYDTSQATGDTVIWSASWTTPHAGTLTLNIYMPDGQLEQHVTASVTSPSCTTTTTLPEVTTTIPEVTTTVPVTVTTAPPTKATPTTVTPARRLALATGHTDPPGALPETGAFTDALIIAGWACLALGLAAVGYLLATRNKRNNGEHARP